MRQRTGQHLHATPGQPARMPHPVGLMRATRAVPPALTGRADLADPIGAPRPAVSIAPQTPRPEAPPAALAAIAGVLADDAITGHAGFPRLALARTIAARLADRGLLA